MEGNPDSSQESDRNENLDLLLDVLEEMYPESSTGRPVPTFVVPRSPVPNIVGSADPSEVPTASHSDGPPALDNGGHPDPGPDIVGLADLASDGIDDDDGDNRIRGLVADGDGDRNNNGPDGGDTTNDDDHGGVNTNNNARGPAANVDGDGEADNSDDGVNNYNARDPAADGDREVNNGDDVNNNATRSPRRNLAVLKHLSSSSAKRRAMKQTHCHFCNFEGARLDLEQHLLEKESCFILYQRKLHVKNLEAILVILYKCLYCPYDKSSLVRHLESHEDCKQNYFHRFHVDTVKEVADIIGNLKRPSFNSRRPLKRKLENAKSKSKKKLKFMNEPESTFTNLHLQQTAFSNYKKCIGCHSDLVSALEINYDTDCKYNLEDKDYLKRLNNFYLCSHCHKSEESEELPELEMFPELRMSTIVSDREAVFKPPILSDNDDQDNDDQNNDLHNVAESKMSVFFPSSIDAVVVGRNFKQYSEHELQRLVYGSGSLTVNKVGCLYQHQFMKYSNVKLRSNYFTGQIDNLETKTLKKVKMCPQEGQIVGSETWKKNNFTDIQYKMTQLGSFCLKVEMKFLIDEPVIATTLIQSGRYVTVSFLGDSSKDLTRKYHVHLGKKSKFNCITETNRYFRSYKQ